MFYMPQTNKLHLSYGKPYLNLCMYLLMYSEKNGQNVNSLAGVITSPLLCNLNNYSTSIFLSECFGIVVQLLLFNCLCDNKRSTTELF